MDDLIYSFQWSVHSMRQKMESIRNRFHFKSNLPFKWKEIEISGDLTEMLDSENV